MPRPTRLPPNVPGPCQPGATATTGTAPPRQHQIHDPHQPPPPRRGQPVEAPQLARFSPLQQGRLPQVALDLTAHLLAPYQWNPLGINPLRELLTRLVDLEALSAPETPLVLVAATDVQIGSARLFSGRSLTIEAVLASACLPQTFQAVEIDGRAYWDGGYVSNPPLVDLVERSVARHVLLIQINALARAHAPASAGEIRNRIGEIVFSRPLALELERLAVWRRVSLWRRCDPRRRIRRLARHRLHQIDGSEALGALDPLTKLVPVWSTLVMLRSLGRSAAEDWLDLRRRPTRVGPGVRTPETASKPQAA